MIKKIVYDSIFLGHAILIVIFFLMTTTYVVEAKIDVIEGMEPLQISVEDSASDARIKSEIRYELRGKLTENNMSGYQLIDIIVPENLPKSGIGTVKLVFNLGNIDVPIVEELNVNRVNISYKNKKEAQKMTIPELNQNPEKIVLKVNTQNHSTEDFSFQWINEKSDPLNLTDWLDNQDDEKLYLLAQSQNEEKISFKERITYEQIEGYLTSEAISEIATKQSESRLAHEVDAEYQLPIILRDELQETKTKEEVESLVNERLQPMFSKVGSKEAIYANYSMNDVSETLNKDTLSGTVVPVTYTVDVNGESVQMPSVNVTVLPEGSIDNLEDWEVIPRYPEDRSLWLLENPITRSKAGFPYRGLEIALESVPWMNYQGVETPKELSFHIVDETMPLQGVLKKGYSRFDEMTAFIPYENNEPIYPNEKEFFYTGIAEKGWGLIPNSDMDITSLFFLAKREKEGEAPTELKQIIVEDNQSFVFVLDLSMKRNLNFEIMMSTYNVGERARDIAMLEMLATDYYGGRVPMFVYGYNRGFYMSPVDESQGARQMTFVLKNKKGQWLSDYTMMAPGELVDIPSSLPKTEYPYARNNLRETNVFGDDFSKPGLESYPNLKDGDLIIEKSETAYQLGAPYKSLGNDDKMRVGYEIFLGNEIPYSSLTLSNDSWTGYLDERPTTMEVPYQLTDLSTNFIQGDTSGFFYSENRDGSGVKVGTYDLPSGEDTIEGTLDLDLKRLMGESTLTDGDIEEYPIPITAVTKTNGNPEMITSEEEIVLITSYAFGAQVKGKTVNKDSKWNTKPEDLLEDKAVLPNHKATYEYVENPPINTKDLGLHWVKVKMSDEIANKTKTYEVPVSVVDGSLPSRGIHLAAKDVTTRPTNIESLTERQLDNYILKESQATAWDNVTGSLDDITKRVISKTVHPNSEPGDYEATIVAENGTEKTEKTIKVTVLTGVDIEVNEDKLPKKIPLGADVKGFDKNIRDWVMVTSGTETVEDYKVILEEFDTHRISDKDKPNGQLKVVVDGNETLVPINIPVVWGNSVAIGGSNTTLMNQESALALSLHDDETGKYLSMSYGNLPENRQHTPLNATLGNKPFVQVKRYATDSWKTGKDDALEVTDGPNKESDVIYSVPGNAVPNDALIKGFGQDGRLTIKEGDVIGLYTADAYHKVLYNDSEGPLKPIQGLPQDNTSFGVVVGDNFYPTYLAHLKPEGVTIPVDDTRSEKAYDDHLATSWRNYLSIPNGVSPSTYAGVEQGGYKKYPTLNLGVGEESAGEVYARQATTVNNQYIKYAYPITVVGSGPDLALDDIPDTIDFGTPLIKSRTQHLQQEKENKVWGFKVMDNREDTKRQPWTIQMKAEPFKTGIQANYQPLKGSVLTIQADKQQVDLNTEFQRVYLNERPEKGTNEVNWTGKDGFYLTVPPGYIKSESPYTSSVDILLSNVPDTSQP